MTEPYNYGAQLAPSDMPTYAQTPPPAPQQRRSSTASRYTPDNYTYAPPSGPGEAQNQVYYPQPRPLQEDLGAAGGSFVPVQPEQYRAPPAASSGAYPPAQLAVSPYSGSPVPEGARHASPQIRRPSAESHRSARSHRSHHSHHEQEHAHHPHSDRHHDHPRQHHHQHHHHHHADDLGDGSEYDKRLTRRDTPRGYGSSLFALFSAVKGALKY